MAQKFQLRLETLSKKLIASLKKKLLFKASKKVKAYSELPSAHSHQEEVDENAFNEALEAQLMAILAENSANMNRENQLEIPVTICIPAALMVQPEFGSLLPKFQSGCQKAQPQC